jgi:hypothetical protein
MERYGLHLSGSGEDPVEGSCECDDEPSVFIECWEYVEYRHKGQLSRRARLHGVR